MPSGTTHPEGRLVAGVILIRSRCLVRLQDSGLKKHIMTYIAYKDYFVNVATGDIPGASIFIMQGETLTVKDVVRGQVYPGDSLSLPTPSSAETLSIVSDSANDSSTGSGAKTITVTGIDDSNTLVSDTVLMNGTTPVITTQSFKRVFLIEATTVGSSGIVSGIITCNGSISSDEYAVLSGDNIAGTGIFTVPVGKVCILGPLVVDLSPGGKSVLVITELQTRSNVIDSPWIVRIRSSQIADTLSNNSQENTYPQVFPTGTDMRFVYSATDDDVTLLAKSHLILQDP